MRIKLVDSHIVAATIVFTTLIARRSAGSPRLASVHKTARKMLAESTPGVGSSIIAVAGCIRTLRCVIKHTRQVLFVYHCSPEEIQQAWIVIAGSNVDNARSLGSNHKERLGSGLESPSTVTCLSSLHGFHTWSLCRALWLFGVVLLISSARINWLKIGPS